jgi:sialidase-1
MKRPLFSSTRGCAALVCGLLAAASAAPTQVEVFRSGEGGYQSYRIPSLIVSMKGTLLAFCEGRVNSASDSGNIDLLLRRSVDNGQTWQATQRIVDFDEDTVGNPAPVLDRSNGTILLLLTSNPGKLTEQQILNGASTRDRTVWITRSTDDGATWTKPEDITTSTKRPEWTWYATGPGNGIQLRSGRLVIPCDHNTREADGRYSHVIYSDDHGATWKIGGDAEVKTNESAVAERKDGSLLLNMRSYHGKNRRAIETSRDGGLTWGPLALDEALIEPVCEASLISTVPWGKRSDGSLLFSNPASTRRERMTVRLSNDDGRTWSHSRVMYEGPSAYSSMAVLRDKSIGMLYERGERGPYERITFAQFSLDWVKGK